MRVRVGFSGTIPSGGDRWGGSPEPSLRPPGCMLLCTCEGGEEVSVMRSSEEVKIWHRIPRGEERKGEERRGEERRGELYVCICMRVMYVYV